MSTLADPDAAPVSEPPPIGILAGNGKFPGEVARAIEARGGRVVIVGIDGEAGAELAGFEVVCAGWGEVGRILAAFKDAGCREIVVVGGVTRPDLARLRPDFGLIRNLPQLVGIVLKGGDDGVLRALIRFIESKGLRVVSPAEVAPGLVLGAGSLGSAVPTAADAVDMLLGSNIVKALGPFDIGQGVIVSGGRIEAIEAAEGTDRMIERVAAKRAGEDAAKRAGEDAQQRRQGAPGGNIGARRGGVLVKRPKPAQEMRVDLPAIGPETAIRAVRAGLSGIAVLAGQTLVADRGDLKRQADAAGLFVYGFTDGGEAVRGGSSGDDGWQAAGIERLSRRQPGARGIQDARFGAAALSRLVGLTETGAAVVRRGHVLGIEPGNGTEELFGRVKRLTQWGEWRLGRRVGVAVLAAGARMDAGIIAAAAAGRLSGVALMGQPRGAVLDEIIRAADSAGLFLIQLRR